MPPATSSQKSWEGMRKRARLLEQSLYSKLGQYAALAARAGGTGGTAMSVAPFVGDADALAHEDSRLRGEIDALLYKLRDALQNMQVQAAEPSATAAMRHSCDRYEAILNDYELESARTQRSVAASLQRAQLLSSSSGPREASESESLLREKNSLHSSVQMVEKIIEQASATSTSLREDGNILTVTVARKLKEVGQKVPSVNELMGFIQRHKQRDTIVLAIVIAICTFFLIIYKFG